MAQEIKRRLFSSRKVLVVLALVLVGALMLALTVFAQGDKVTLTVESTQGYVGERVAIPVTITNYSGVAGVTSKIYYDDSIINPEMIEDEWEPGKYIPNVVLGNIVHPTQTFFMSNKLSDERGPYISIVVASTYSFSGDGTICTLYFNLENNGVSNLELDVETVSGVDVSIDDYIKVNGTITVLGTGLVKVGQPTWDGDVITWTNVENAANYEVVLYKDGTPVDTQTVSQETNSYNFASKIASLSPGVFTVTVQAKGDNDPWTDGDVSDQSADNTKTQTLAKVDKPVWDGWAITWTDVENAASYEIKLYRGDELVATENVGQGIGKYNFNAETAAAGSYTATVQALGDGALYLDGNVSNRSDAKARKIKLPMVSKPAWDGDGVIKWSAVDNADKYRVELFKGGNVYKTKTTTALTYDFLEIMRDGGVASYSVKVTALAAAGSYYEDGDASSLSDSQNIVQLQVGKPDLSDQGVASWEAVEHAEDYKVHLYKDGAQIADAETAGDNTYEFLEAIRAEGSGDYSVTVTALGTGLYLTSEESTFSEAITVAVLTIEAPLWKLSSDPGVTLIALEWDEVEGAAAYTVTIYSGSEEDPIETAQVSGTDYQFDPDEAGFYWATVQAIGDGELILDSLPSGYSNVLVSFSQGNDVGDNDADEPHYVARGLLPVANLLMEITSVTGNDGVMSVGRADCAYDPPEGLFAAGIFFDIELDENLSGSLVEMHAFYDPATLPKRMIEASLCFYRYDEEEEAWVLLESEVNSDLKAVSARVEQFSTVGLFGEVSPPPVEEPGDEPGDKKIEDEKAKGELPQTYGYIPYLLLGGLALALMGLVFLVRRIRYEGR
ncbi:MAG: cohesin domain-containing protein [Dethiobacteria bacterium]|jgi:hypothetical protein